MVRIGIVGTGGIARRHMAALQESNKAKIVAAIDLDRKRAEEAAGKSGATVYDTVEEAVDHIDALYVLTPPSSHRELALAAINAGKHVLCEKPMAVSPEDAEAMVRGAREAGIKFMMGFNKRFTRGFSRLRQLVESGELGGVLNFWSHRLGMMGRGPAYNWRTDPKLLCGMSIESLSHDIDLMRWVAGEVTDVRANVLASRPDLPTFDDFSNVVVSLADGGTGLIHASWASHVGRHSRGIIGTKGSAYIEGPDAWEAQALRWKTDDMEHEVIEDVREPSPGTSFAKETEHFLDCIENDRQPAITAEDGLAALRISRAILDSHRLNQVIRLR